MAEKTAEKTAEKAPHVVKSGGKKGELIVAALKEDPSRTRSQLAELAEATTGRVGEVIRWLAKEGTKEEKALIARHKEAQPKRVAPTRPTKGPKVPASKKVSASKSGGTNAGRTRKPRGAAKKTAQAEKDQSAGS